MQQHDSLLRLPEVLKIVPVSRSSWYAGIKEGIYPNSVPLGKRSVGWRKSEVQEVVRYGALNIIKH